jgi:hypothetical protein
MTDVVNTGTAANSGNGDPLRTAFQAINAKFVAQDADITERFNQAGMLLVNRGAWAPSRTYEATPQREWVVNGGQAYVVASNHVSGASFATDLASGKWLAADVAQLITDLAASSGSNLIGYMPDGVGAVASTVQAKLRESVSVLDFYANGVSGVKVDPTGVVDSTLGIQAFFDYISSVDVGVAVCDGSFLVSSGIFIGPSTGTMKTLSIMGSPTFTASGAIDTVVTMRNCQDLFWSGVVSAIGTGSNSYVSRTCRVGIKIGDNGTVSRMTLGGLVARKFNQVGVSVRELSTLSDLGNIRVSDCGSGYSSSGYSLEGTWNTKVDTGTSGSTGQLSTITVNVLPPSMDASQPTFIIINGQPYYVSSVDAVNMKLSVFPWIDTSLSSGSFRYLFGGGVYTSGGDAGILGIGMVDAVRCSVGLHTDALYGMIASRVVTQFCGVGFAVGGSPSGAAVTFQINGIYCENNDFDLLRVTRSKIGGHIVSEYAFNFGKVAWVTAPRSSANALLGSTGGALSSIIIDSIGVSHSHSKSPMNLADGGSTLALNIFESPNWSKIFRKNSWSVNLATPDSTKNNCFGYDAATLVCIGTGTGGKPTGTFTFNAPVGSTVNGLSTTTFTGFTGPAVFYIYYVFSSSDYEVFCMTEASAGSATYDPPSLADGEGAVTTVTVPGAVLGDYSSASFSRDLQGITLTSWVSAADTVSVRFQNETGTTVNLAAGTLKANARD